MDRGARESARTEVFGSIFLLAQHLTRRVDAALDPLGLTTKQWLLLALLLKRFAGESPTLTEAARAYGSSRQNVKQIAQQLESRGYLRIETDPNDARAQRLRLLPKIGAFDTRPEKARQEALMDEVFAWARPEELEQMRALLRRWIATFSHQE